MQRWREIPKPTIGQAHGRTIAAGLMLLWPIDIIVAASDATFSDPVTAFGVNGIEMLAHAWELGARKAKEVLFTGRALTAPGRREVGMVNHVVAPADLESFTTELATQDRDASGIRASARQGKREPQPRRPGAIHGLGRGDRAAQLGGMPAIWRVMGRSWIRLAPK